MNSSITAVIATASFGGKSPLQAFAASKTKPRFPSQDVAPKHRLEKPETGRYHVVRLICSDMKLNNFGELFPVTPELKFEYVVATIDVKDQKLNSSRTKPRLRNSSIIYYEKPRVHDVVALNS